jgi:hypothetical protein
MLTIDALMYDNTIKYGDCIYVSVHNFSGIRPKFEAGGVSQVMQKKKRPNRYLKTDSALNNIFRVGFSEILLSKGLVFLCHYNLKKKNFLFGSSIAKL